MKTFEQWKEQELQLTFGLKKVKDHPLLTDWLKPQVATAPPKKEFLLGLQAYLLENADYWNEDEAKFYFIAPLTALIRFSGEDYDSFNQLNTLCPINIFLF